jgi:hypothetical protein
MDAYAMVKLLVTGQDRSPADNAIWSLINLAPNEAVAAEVLDRLARSCQRFLDLRLIAAGCLLTDPEITSAGMAHCPFVGRGGAARSALVLEQVAERIAAMAEPRSRRAAA